jgi:hypothetical protein
MQDYRTRTDQAVIIHSATLHMDAMADNTAIANDRVQLGGAVHHRPVLN